MAWPPQVDLVVAETPDVRIGVELVCPDPHGRALRHPTYISHYLSAVASAASEQELPVGDLLDVIKLVVYGGAGRVGESSARRVPTALSPALAEAGQDVQRLRPRSHRGRFGPQQGSVNVPRSSSEPLEVLNPW